MWDRFTDGRVPEVGMKCKKSSLRFEAVAKTVNLCGKTVVKLGEKKAYDETPSEGGRGNGRPKTVLA